MHWNPCRVPRCAAFWTAFVYSEGVQCPPYANTPWCVAFLIALVASTSLGGETPSCVSLCAGGVAGVLARRCGPGRLTGSSRQSSRPRWLRTMPLTSF